jgi:uncharacterized membrane protein
MIEPEVDASRFWWRKRTVWAGAALSAAAAAESFGPSLMPRGGHHQALVTGASGLAGWIVGVIAAGRLTRSSSPERNLVTAVAATIGGVAAAAALRPSADEPMWKATVRAGGIAVAAGSLASTSVSAVEASRHRAVTATALAATGAAAGGVTIARGVKAQARHRDEYDRPTPRVGKALLAGTGVLGGLGLISTGWRLGGGAIARSLHRRTGMPPLAARLTGNGASAALWAGAGFGMYRAAVGALAIYDRVMDPGYDRPPESSLRSAGPGSALSFSRTGRQGRRFITDVPTPEEIESVMGTPAVNEPIRVFVGYDAARAREDRVELAMSELRRTGAFDRDLLIVSCPAGTGYVNTLPMEVADYVTLGEAASVAVQYARLPSLLAIQQTPEGAEHHRLLLQSIRAELAERPPGKRPRVVVYGESLGAWAGQDAFIGKTLAGFDDLGVDVALWVGTPYYSKWRHEALASESSKSERGRSVVEINSISDLDPDPAGKRRVVLLTHNNDPVNLLEASIIIREPEWLGRERLPGVPREQQWVPFITAIQTIVDTINATNPVPGVFRATGHDYRADLPRVTVAAYRLPEPTEEQWARLLEHLQSIEAARAAKFKEDDEAGVERAVRED